MPTLTALAGWAPPKDKPLKWDGRNLLPVLTLKIQPGPRPLYWAAPGVRARALRVGDHKLIVSGQNSTFTTELFNLKDDPTETQDLAPTQPEKVKTLRALLDKIARSDRDALPPKDP
jgi:arylsulfatase A-like enzyme